MTIKLYIKDKSGFEQVLEFSAPEIFIGRAQDNEVVLKDVRSSRKHCRISRTPQGVLLEDLKSANGTLLRGEAIKAGFLQPGDEFRIGDTSLYFQELPAGVAPFRGNGSPGDDDPAETIADDGLGQMKTATTLSGSAAASDAVQEDVLEDDVLDDDLDLDLDADEDDADEDESGEDRAGSKAAEHRKGAAGDGAATGAARDIATAYLEGLEGYLRGKKVPLEKTPLTIGRSSKNDICIRDPRASSQHARFVFDGDRWIVEDLGSTNGLLVNNKRIRRSALRTGSRVAVGNSVFRVVVAGAGSAAAGIDPAEDAAAGEWGGQQLRSQVDIQRVHGSDAEQPVAVIALVVIVGLLTYFGIDIARRVLIENEVDPPAGGNVVVNWSFERAPAEGEIGIPGWTVGEDDPARLELDTEKAQFPGKRSARLTLEGNGFGRATQAAPITLGTERRYVLEGFAANKGVFLAGFLIDWLQERGDRRAVIERSYSETTQDAGSLLNAYLEVEAPASATHARVACFAFGDGGSAVFDQVSLVPRGDVAAEIGLDEPGAGADDGDLGAEEGDDADAVDDEVSPDNRTVEIRTASGLALTLERGGYFSLSKRQGRLRLNAIWAGVPLARDPLGFGPRVAATTVQSGDRGSVLVASKAPDSETRRLVTVEAAVVEAPESIDTRWRLRADDEEGQSERIVLYLESRNESLPLVAHGSGTATSMLFEEANGGPFDELAIGELSERVSLTFSTPVQFASQPHPVVDGTWLLAVSPVDAEKSLGVTFSHGSQRERDAADAAIRLAEEQYRKGQIARAMALLARVPAQFPQQGAALQRAAKMLRRWQDEARNAVEEVRQGLEEVERNPSPVVRESILSRVRYLAKVYAGTPAATEMGPHLKTLEAVAGERRRQRKAEEDLALYERAEGLYPDQIGLSELYLRALLRSDPEPSLQEKATRFLQRIEARQGAR